VTLAGPTLAVRPGRQVAAAVVAVSASDTKLLAINAARTIQFRSNRRQAGRSCVAIVLVQVVHNRGSDVDLKVR